MLRISNLIQTQTTYPFTGQKFQISDDENKTKKNKKKT